MNHVVMRCLAILTFAVLPGCATSRLVTQQSNPDYVGKSFNSVMVVGVTSDEIVRRTFEDRVAALLDKRGLKGIPAYSVVGSRGKVEEAGLREAIARSGAEGVLITRVTRVERESGTVPGATVGVGLYGYYGGVWETVTTAPQQISGPSWTLSETRLFDARTGALAWTGIVDTRENDDLGAAMTQYVNIIFDAMVRDRVL
ncbi:MAG TPA: hypothetical protein VFJ70_01300 [Burkholderiales bacterium]|nr:hypothetical protein [Burkholderiales bacterium]